MTHGSRAEVHARRKSRWEVNYLSQFWNKNAVVFYQNQTMIPSLAQLPMLLTRIAFIPTWSYTLLRYVWCIHVLGWEHLLIFRVYCLREWGKQQPWLWNLNWHTHKLVQSEFVPVRRPFKLSKSVFTVRIPPLSTCAQYQVGWKMTRRNFKYSVIETWKFFVLIIFYKYNKSVCRFHRFLFVINTKSS